MNATNPALNSKEFPAFLNVQPDNEIDVSDPARAAKLRRMRTRFLPFVLASTIGMAGTSIYTVKKLSGNSKEKPVPSLIDVKTGAHGLATSTPTLDESQAQRWPAQETVQATQEQASAGASGIMAGVNQEIIDGGPQLSNQKTTEAIEADIKNQADALHGPGNNGAIQTGDTFSVPDIHPNLPNTVIGGNQNIPAK